MTQSHELITRAKQHIPGGVNSPVRAFAGVGGDPVFISRAEAAYMYGADGKRYIDYVGSWGPMIAGHANPEVLDAVRNAIDSGLSFGAPTETEITMAEAVCDIVPSMDMVRMVNSGTEATMSAIRLARGFTGRDKILKFEGCYHGHGDSLLVKAGSGALTLGVPSSPGVPEGLAQHTLTADFNDLSSVEALFQQFPEDIACIIVEPVAGNMNCIPPEEGFLEGLRTLCDQYAALLIFDEVMTGFRVARGGAQEMFDVQPDLTTLGKIIGGGLPVGAFGGKREIMEKLAPVGPVYQAGTLSGNPVAMAAGLKTLEIISREGFYENLFAKTSTLLAGLRERAEAANVPFLTSQAGAMFGLFFTEQDDVKSFADVGKCNIDAFKTFFHGMLDNGVYLAPSAYEAGFVSSVHSDQDLEDTLAAAEKAFALL